MKRSNKNRRSDIRWVAVGTRTSKTKEKQGSVLAAFEGKPTDPAGLSCVFPNKVLGNRAAASDRLQKQMVESHTGQTTVSLCE